VHLESYNAKHAQFKLLPRYKVKSEGEFVSQLILSRDNGRGVARSNKVEWTVWVDVGRGVPSQVRG